MAPQLDVSEVFSCPDLMDTFRWYRQPEAVDDDGRAQVTEAAAQTGIGQVKPASGEDLERIPEADRTNRVLAVVTQVRLRAASRDGSQDYAPDQIEWPPQSGERYEVKDVKPYTRYGAGFTKAIVIGIEPVGAPPA